MVENGLEIIGFFIWWSVHNLRVRQDAVKDMIEKIGFDYKVKEVPLRSNFLDAVRHVKRSYAKEGLLVRQINKVSDCYTFGLVDEKVDKTQESLGYKHTATVRFNPETGNLQCDEPKHRAYKLIVQHYEELKDYYTSDHIRKIVFEILDNAHLVSVRSHGGIYFVPATESPLVDKLDAFLNELPGDCSFVAAPQIDTERTKKSIYKAFIHDLRERIVQYKLELDEDNADKLSQGAALRARHEEFKKLRSEIQFYSDTLKFQAEDLDQELVALGETVKTKLLKIA